LDVEIKEKSYFFSPFLNETFLKTFPDLLTLTCPFLHPVFLVHSKVSSKYTFSIPLRPVGKCHRPAVERRSFYFAHYSLLTFPHLLSPVVASPLSFSLLLFFLVYSFPLLSFYHIFSLFICPSPSLVIMPLPLVVVWLIEEARQTRSLPELVQFKI
jgi:hypothetical protein